MFERNPVDNISAVTVAIEATLDDGRVITGRAAVSNARAVHKLMDGSEPFLYVEEFDGEATFVPKASIKALKLVTPMRPQALNARVQDATSFDPYRVLGIGKSAPWDEIKSAYHRLSKLYHPDVYASVTLPPEVATYLGARASEINAAFRLLKSREAAKPVYTKPAN
ncbi:MAG: J domain-containing protein [Hyphomicrobiaceae bacterium]|nr:J domain-containing protein [Hyphomicrobiaceae bacterium]